MQTLGPAGRPRDDAPRLERYQSDDDQLVIFNPGSLHAEWIAADPTDLMEVIDG